MFSFGEPLALALVFTARITFRVNRSPQNHARHFPCTVVVLVHNNTAVRSWSVYPIPWGVKVSSHLGCSVHVRVGEYHLYALELVYWNPLLWLSGQMATRSSGPTMGKYRGGDLFYMMW